MDQELYTEMLAGSLRTRRADAASALTRWQYFYVWSDVNVAAILKVSRQIENPTPPIDAATLFKKA